MTSKRAIKAKITLALRRHIRGKGSQFDRLIPKAKTSGKLYEAYVLALVCRKLKTLESCQLTLIGSNRIVLKSSPGPINGNYPHIKVEKHGIHLANIWTDIEFTSLSASKAGRHPLGLGDYHEIDIAVVTPSASSRPTPDQVLLAVECKHTGYQKNLLREILGVRREMSFLAKPTATAFSHWPRNAVPADPPACVAVFSSDQGVTQYASPGQFFGIDFFHQPLR